MPNPQQQKIITERLHKLGRNVAFKNTVLKKKNLTNTGLGLQQKKKKNFTYT